MVFYFTGTGNCLYIAKQLEAQPVSIPQVIHQENLHFCDKSIGIVAPVYGHEVPGMVKEFLHKATFDTDYFYMIPTYGNRHGGAAELAEQLCRECGVRVDYINVLLMVDNWLPSFDMDEQRKMDKNVQGQLDAILSDLKKRRKMISPVTDTDRAAHRQFLDRMSQMPPDAWQHLQGLLLLQKGRRVHSEGRRPRHPAADDRGRRHRAGHTGLFLHHERPAQDADRPLPGLRGKADRQGVLLHCDGGRG